MNERTARTVRTFVVLLLASLSLPSCRDRVDDAAAQTATTALTEDESLIRTTWHVVEITGPDGESYLPYDGRPGPTEGPPVVAYDHTGHLARVADGQHSYAAERSSNTFDMGLVFGARAAFPDHVRFVLFYGTADRDGATLTLSWSGYAAQLTLVAEDRYTPTTSAAASTS